MLVCVWHRNWLLKQRLQFRFVVSENRSPNHIHINTFRWHRIASRRFVCPMTINFTHWFVALTWHDTIREWCARCLAFSDSNVSHNARSRNDEHSAPSPSQVLWNGFGRSHIFTSGDSWRTVWATIFNRISNLNKRVTVSGPWAS